MKLHPNITIEETSIEFEGDYYHALLTHLAGGAGLSDIQGIEVARIAEITQTQSRTTCMARLHPRSSARAGEPLELAVDTVRLHFFDPSTQQSIW